MLKNNISDYFNDIEILIYLAANPNPFIKKEEADKNVEIARNVIKACDYAKNLNKCEFY